MASISRSRRLPEPRSGGKIVRPRRTASARTPYDRPPPSNSAPPSPNWLSRFVFSPTRFIASGAGKLLSSVFDSEPSPTSSSSFSSSSSSSGSDSGAEEEIGTVNNENGVPFQGNDALNKDLQPLVGNSKNKHVIEELLMQETFSREECDRFIRIIRSRIVDSPANEDEGDKRPSDMHKEAPVNDTDSPDLSSAAVMEAKKWLQDKKSRLDSNSDIGFGSHSLNLVALPQAIKDEGSPVDVAKSYMRARPPWSSPSIDHIKSSTSIGIQLFKEETPYPISGNSTSSSKLKRDSPATGSWSIQDEIRRVRSRATEQMLRTLPSSEIDWSAFAAECRTNVNYSAIENIEASMGEKVHNLSKSIDASSNLVKELSTHAPPDLERKQDAVQLESVLSDPANTNSEQNQGFETTIWQTEGSQDDCGEITTSGHKPRSSDDMIKYSDDGLVKVNGVNDTNGATYELDSVKETREVSDSRLHDENCSIFEKVGAEYALENGFPSSGPSNAGQIIEQNTETSENEHNAVGSSDERIAKGVIELETCELSETCMEVPEPDVTLNVNNVTINEDDGVVSLSQNSSSVHYELEQEHSEAGPEPDMADSIKSTVEKQKGKRISRYNRRGRSRGKSAK